MGYKMKGMSFKSSPVTKKDGDTASKEVLSAENPDTYVYKGNKNLSDKDNITQKIASMEDRVSAIKEDITNDVFDGSDLDRAKNDISTINAQISKLKALKNTKDFG
tara:strand:+ start:440 stop:757 length:318 start_codon:yes stop_codon:yes gene_type:complete